MMKRVFWTTFFGCLAILPFAARGQENLSSPVGWKPVLKVIELVLEHHIEPPAPQQVAWKAAQSYLASSHNPPQPGLVKKTWNLGSIEKVASFFEELESDFPDRSPDRSQTWERVIRKLTGDFPELNFIETKEALVQDSIASNRYVGIGISLHHEKGNHPKMGQVFPGGPAYRAGASDGDRIASVDGRDTKNLSLRQTIDLLRGARGTKVELELRKAGGEPYKRTITRDVVPFSSLSHRFSNGSTGVLDALAKEAGVLIITVNSIRSSTVSELRELESKTTGRTGVILDLRRVAPATRVHDAVLLANALMDGGKIGQVRTVDGVREYEAEPDRLFPGLKLAVLVADQSSLAAWIANAVDRVGHGSAIFTLKSNRPLNFAMIEALRESGISEAPIVERSKPNFLRESEVPFRISVSRYFEVTGTSLSVSIPYCRAEPPPSPRNDANRKLLFLPGNEMIPAAVEILQLGKERWEAQHAR